MTFEQYCNSMIACNFKVIYDTKDGKLGNIYVTTMNGRKLFRFDSASNQYTGIRLYGEVEYISFSALSIILELTNKFLATPYGDRQLNATYHLLVGSTIKGTWLLGYNKGVWDTNSEEVLKENGYQTTFTDNDLISIASGDIKLLTKLNALKERI